MTRVPLTDLRDNVTYTDEPIGSPAFIERARQADHSQPVLLEREPDGTLSIVDGVHRVWWAEHTGKTDILAQIKEPG